jgi:hypothetical protein
MVAQITSPVTSAGAFIGYRAGPMLTATLANNCQEAIKIVKPNDEIQIANM